MGLDGDDRVVRFLEKPRPEDVFSHWVSAGIFVLERGVLDLIPEGEPSGFRALTDPELPDWAAELGRVLFTCSRQGSTSGGEGSRKKSRRSFSLGKRGVRCYSTFWERGGAGARRVERPGGHRRW